MGEPDTYCQEVAAAAGGGARRALAADLPDEAEALREELAPVVAELAALEGEPQRRRMVDVGLVMPHWPRPWGRDAGAVEQVVIEELLASAGVSRPHIGIGAWALPPIIARGTELQRERWVDATLMGALHWCQLFSEPGAGSDLASLSTRAERTEGGWSLTGQKVWTSMARDARVGDLPGPDRSGRGQAPGHHLLRRRHELARAGRAARCASSPGRPCSTRCSSTMSSSPTTA